MKYVRNKLVKSVRFHESIQRKLIVLASQYSYGFFRDAYCWDYKLHIKFKCGIANPQGGKSGKEPHLDHVIPHDFCGEDEIYNYIYLAKDENIDLSNKVILHALYLAWLEGEPGIDKKRFEFEFEDKYGHWKRTGEISFNWPFYLLDYDERNGRLIPIFPGLNVDNLEVDVERAFLETNRRKALNQVQWLAACQDDWAKKKFIEQYQIEYNCSPQNFID